MFHVFQIMSNCLGRNLHRGEYTHRFVFLYLEDITQWCKHNYEVCLQVEKYII